MKTYSYNTQKEVYTEWNVTITYKPLDDNRQWKVYNYQYVRRIKEQPIDDDQLDNKAFNRLRSFETKEVEYTNVNTFRFGKYTGRDIEQVLDIRYTCWYFEQIDGDHKQYVRDFLYNHYCEFRTNWEGKEYAVTCETVNKEAEENARKENALKKALKSASEGEQIYLDITSNPNEKGEIVIDKVTYTFPKVAVRYYQGYSYFVPVKNGQAKRIKNKRIIANLFPVGDKIFISNFTVCK